VGKIDRLPRAVRVQLNQRLAEGELGKALVEWLNGLAETQAVLARDFGGRAINEQNLSEWRRGGFADWQRNEETRAWMRMLAEEDYDLSEIADSMELDERTNTQAPTGHQAREDSLLELPASSDFTRAARSAKSP
jgi:hypothetical protein